MRNVLKHLGLKQSHALWGAWVFWSRYCKLRRVFICRFKGHTMQRSIGIVDWHEEVCSLCQTRVIVWENANAKP